MLLIELALAAAGLYGVVILILTLLQTSMLFPIGLVAQAPGELPAPTRRLAVKATDGTELSGLYVPASANSERLSDVLVLGFGGNAWNAGVMAAYLHELLPDHDVAAFHYRGYRPSQGRPSAGALLRDALVVHDELAKSNPGKSVLAIGFSIGAGPAMHLARHRQLAGVVLVTPFDSLAALAAHHYRWVPVRLLLRHHMEVAEDAEKVDEPVAIITAERDSIVPAERSAALRRRIRHLVFQRTIAGADHNSLYEEPAFAAALREAVALMERHAAGER